MTLFPDTIRSLYIIKSALPRSLDVKEWWIDLTRRLSSHVSGSISSIVFYFCSAWSTLVFWQKERTRHLEYWTRWWAVALRFHMLRGTSSFRSCFMWTTFRHQNNGHFTDLSFWQAHSDQHLCYISLDDVMVHAWASRNVIISLSTKEFAEPCKARESSSSTKCDVFAASHCL